VNNVETGIGSEVLVSGLAYTPGNFLWLRAQVSGTSPTALKIRAWADGSSEPTTWQYSGTDSTAALSVAGAVGIRTYLSVPVTNGPLTVRIDDLRATRPQ
jgi:hypothetical protein